jgi:hypothetical protein
MAPDGTELKEGMVETAGTWTTPQLPRKCMRYHSIPFSQAPMLKKSTTGSVCPGHKREGVKSPRALALWLALLGIIGCRQPAPPPPPSGVNVQFPGGSVKVNERGTNVIAPGTQVLVP